MTSRRITAALVRRPEADTVPTPLSVVVANLGFENDEEPTCEDLTGLVELPKIARPRRVPPPFSRKRAVGSPSDFSEEAATTPRK
ncbi:MAG: hypothetical protein JWO36_4890 [Myxococcales bacterium]|nr:hypothetical protein [Myxococcales bacterium]